MRPAHPSHPARAVPHVDPLQPLMPPNKLAHTVPTIAVVPYPQGSHSKVLERGQRRRVVRENDHGVPREKFEVVCEPQRRDLRQVRQHAPVDGVPPEFAVRVAHVVSHAARARGADVQMRERGEGGVQRGRGEERVGQRREVRQRQRAQVGPGGADGGEQRVLQVEGPAAARIPGDVRESRVEDEAQRREAAGQMHRERERGDERVCDSWPVATPRRD
ncbi:hypothetical protein FA95DRAFT_1566168 [Auriscalpium vulgare]|uniref:Uncharacterized protein n=1 Tax=Auriscalpium vulgare TaxID=40419 RepID=A0ACB8RAT7_9AGAM|nr:hypothetical protein FA95DRAFT_1566168 [Auriscalpium vulgare]